MNDPRKLSFWVREKKQSNAEVDFVVPFKQYVIPVEVKSAPRENRLFGFP
jgi:hypothetical protein